MDEKTAGFSLGAKMKPLLLCISVFGASFILEHLLVDGVPFVFTELGIADEQFIPWLYSFIVICVYGGAWLLVRRALLPYLSHIKPSNARLSHGGYSRGCGISDEMSTHEAVKWGFISVSLGAGVGLLALVPGLLLAYFDGRVPMPSQVWHGISGVPNWEDIGNTVVACLVAPIIEELWYRDLGLSALVNLGLSFRCANVFQSLLFACAHRGVAEQLFAFTTGILLGLVRGKTGMVSFCVIVHGVTNSEIANLCAALIYQFFLACECFIGSTTSHQAALETFGVSGTFIFAVLIAFIGLLLLLPFWRKQTLYKGGLL